MTFIRPLIRPTCSSSETVYNFVVCSREHVTLCTYGKRDLPSLTLSMISTSLLVQMAPRVVDLLSCFVLFGNVVGIASATTCYATASQSSRTPMPGGWFLVGDSSHDSSVLEVIHRALTSINQRSTNGQQWELVRDSNDTLQGVESFEKVHRVSNIFDQFEALVVLMCSR